MSEMPLDITTSEISEAQPRPRDTYRPCFVIDEDTTPELKGLFLVDEQWLMRDPAKRAVELHNYNAGTTRDQNERAMWERLLGRRAAFLDFDPQTKEAITSDKQHAALVREYENLDRRSAQATTTMQSMRTRRLEIFLRRVQTTKRLGAISFPEES